MKKNNITNKTLYPRIKLQNAMNTTRNKLNKGKFNRESFEIVEEIIETDKIPEEFDNYTIIQLTDIHIGQWINKEILEGIIEIVNELNADLIVMTGDYVSYKTEEHLDELEEAFKKIKRHDAILSVLGNHDHWTDSDKVKKTLKNAGIINLENDVYSIERNDKRLQIAGADSTTYNKDNIDKIINKIDKEYPAIMLVHEPDFADITSKYDSFFLQLSGHSHGGQIEIPKIGTPVRGKNFKKYPSGRYEVNNMVQYTSRGVGTNAFWIRINCPPEITKITLKKI